ncbi:MAG TPA: NAD(P)H-dependent oxidoreductase, partial [Desulfitobacterium dehalogenans]|nr:NAD(P)H-dependent oxidoreductase [Desulfitobacterium dehalogenans]
MSRIKIGVLVGSLRKDSFCRKLSKALKEVAPESFDLEEVEIGELALYNQDLDEPDNLPEAWTVFREKMRSYDAFIFVSPEYNRSVPAVLKNALDVGSRPPSKSVWGGKPGAVLTASP